MGKLLRRVEYWLRRRERDADLAEEMEFHRAMLGEQAKDAMGNTTLAREDARSVWIWPWLESFYRDLVHGLRAMRREPGVTVVALAALGSAIGLNTSLYTGFNALALKPWPVKDPAHVVTMRGGYSIAESRYLAEHTRSMSGVIAMREGTARLEGQPLRSVYVSGNYFHVLGVEMRRGRGFRDDEDRAGNPQAVAVIGYTLWQNRFGGDAAIIGSRIRLDDVPFTVVGVAPREFSGTDINRADVWLPLASMLLLRPNDPGALPFLISATNCCSEMAGRLAPGATREQARAETELLLNQFRSQFHVEPVRVELRDTSWLARADRKARRALPIVGMMFLGVTMVLLLACANVGNLLLARAAARRQEIAVRLSLGGSRGRLVRQLLVESLALALMASAIGWAIAMVLPDVVIARLSHSAAVRIAPDFSVLAYNVLMAVIACAVFGLAPALHATRGNIAEALKQESRLAGVRLSLRGALLAAQVAFSVVLLAAAGMLVRGVQKAGTLDLGFNINGVSVISVDLPANAYAGPRTGAFTRQLMTQLEAAPGGPRLAFCDLAPLSNSNNMRPFRLPGEDQQSTRGVIFHTVTPAYFEVLGIPIVAGRNFTAGDAGRPVALVNETLARRYWPDENPVGKTVISDTPFQIVGIVGDALTQDLQPGIFILYLPMAGGAVPQMLVRGNGPAAAQRVAAVAKGLEPRVQVESKPLVENFRRAMEPGVAGAMLAGGLGILALLLAAIGMSGVFAYAVRQRTREIGIRMALGAKPADAVGLVLASSLRALAVGLAAGLAGAIAVSRLLGHTFFGVNPSDPVAYGGVLLVLLLTGVAASAAPARRAARVDPVKALRWE